MACKLNNVCTGIINEYIPYKLEQINTTKVWLDNVSKSSVYNICNVFFDTVDCMAWL
jgi:hypothetical protein